MPNGPGVDTFQTALSKFQVAYSDMGIADADRAFAYCRGPGEPEPGLTPIPDPSGHSRAEARPTGTRLKAKE